MGTITDTALAAAVTHNSAGVPANCAVANNKTDGTGLTEPTGGLIGTASMLNVAAGVDATYDPVALTAFSNVQIWALPGSIRPDMTDVTPKSSSIFKAGAVVTDAWARGVAGSAADPVTAVLMHESLMNDYVLDTATLSGTDWVITMPTKRHYIGVAATATSSVTAITPFTTDFFTGGACEPIAIAYWDREERSPSTPSQPISPLPPGVAGDSLCWESTVMTFNNSDILGSSNKVNKSIDASYQNGWARIMFVNANHNMTATNTYRGLPAIGFMVQDFVNGNVGGVLSNYVGNFSHKYTTNVNGSTAE